MKHIFSGFPPKADMPRATFAALRVRSPIASLGSCATNFPTTTGSLYSDPVGEFLLRPILFLAQAPDVLGEERLRGMRIPSHRHDGRRRRPVCLSAIP
jgi:hypothetical protein